jgi:hypothetical protein
VYTALVSFLKRQICAQSRGFLENLSCLDSSLFFELSHVTFSTLREEVDQRGDGTGTLGSTGTVRLKHDLMHEGIDWDHVLKYEEKIQELKKKALVPMDYTVHAPIQLIPERFVIFYSLSTIFLCFIFFLFSE